MTSPVRRRPNALAYAAGRIAGWLLILALSALALALLVTVVRVTVWALTGWSW